MIPQEIIESALKIKWFFLLIIAIGILMAYASILILGDNNIIEVKIEEMIEAETGMKIDITPSDSK